MTDQPTPDTDDPTVSDSELSQTDRDQIRDTARALVDGSLRMDADEYAGLPRRVRRRAWMRYQAHFEDDEPTRERHGREEAARENEMARRRAREIEEEEARGADVG